MDEVDSILQPAFCNPKRLGFLLSLIKIFPNDFGSLLAF